MTYHADTLTGMVRMAINRMAGWRDARHPDPFPEDDDGCVLTLDRLICNHLPTAVRQVCSEVPLSDLADSARSFAGMPVYRHRRLKGTYSGHVPLPDDFFRLISFRMSDWPQAVNSFTDPSQAEARFRASRYPSLRGVPEHPLCYDTVTATGRALEFYSSRDRNAAIAEALYLPYPVWQDNAMEIPCRLLDKVIAQVINQIETSLK